MTPFLNFRTLELFYFETHQCIFIFQVTLTHLYSIPSKISLKKNLFSLIKIHFFL